MYLYSLRGQKHNAVLTHKEKFSQSEFTDMCDEVEKLEMPYYTMGDESLYDESAVRHHLITRYGFQIANYQAVIITD